MARYWSDGYGGTEQVGNPAEHVVTVIDKQRWDGKQDRLYFDDVPTFGSRSPVTSDGVARALEDVRKYVRQKDVELFYIDIITLDGVETLSEKTYLDIYEAYKNGRTLILRFAEDADRCAYFYDFQGNVFRFVLFETTDVLNMYMYWISPDDLLHVELFSAPYKRPNPETFAITYGETTATYDGSKHTSMNIPKVPAWALGDTKPKYTASEVGAEAQGTAAGLLNSHDSNPNAHADIRNIVANIMNRFNSYATTASVQSVTNLVNSNANKIQQLRTDAVLKNEVVDDLYTNSNYAPLSAKQGMILRTLFDTLKPTGTGVVMWNGERCETAGFYSTVPLAGLFPCADGGGRLSTNAPVDALHCANKKYVDDAILSSVVITEKADGETPVITDCAAVAPRNIKLFGKGMQDIIPGNQLFDVSKIPTTTIGNVTITNNGDGSLTISGEGNLTQGVDIRYTLTHEETVKMIKAGRMHFYAGASTYPYFDIGIRTASGKGVGLYNASAPYNNNNIPEEIINDETCYFKVILYGASGQPIVPATIKPMVYQDGDGTWEPFVGGEQSPNMRYPQIPVFHGESGSIEGKVLNSNVVNYYDSTNKCIKQDNGKYTMSKNTDGYYAGERMNIGKFLTPNQEYTLALHGTSGVEFVVATIVNGETIWKCVAKNGAASVGSTFTFAENEIENAFCQAQILSGNAQGEYEFWYSFVVGNEVPDWQPYTEQPFTALTPNGLKGIPLGTTIPDAIKNSPIHMSGVYWDKAEGQYYIGDTKNENGKDVQRIFKVRLLAEQVHIIDSLCNEESNLFYVFLGTWYMRSYVGDFLCDITSYKAEGVSCTKGDCTDNCGCLNVAEQSNNLFYIRVRKDSGITTLDGFKEYLTNNEVYITLILPEPITTDPTAEELDQYNALVMNYPITSVVNDAGAYMEVEYVADPALYIEGHYIAKEQHQALADRVLALEQIIVNS